MTGPAYAAAPRPAAPTLTVAKPARHVAHVMGMPLTLALRGRHRDDRVARTVWDDVVRELREVDAVFSPYRADSWVSRHNRGERVERRTDVDEVLALAAQTEQASGGAFRVRLPDPDGGTRLDPSGVVKGWAVQRAARHLDRLAATEACLALAGDVVCRTPGHGARPWRVGIEDPRDRRRLLTAVEVGTGAVATSGSSARGPHVVDGRTGRPAEGLVQVTVLAPDLTDADVWATTVLAMGPDGGRWLAQRPEASGLLVHLDGSLERVGLWA